MSDKSTYSKQTFLFFLANVIAFLISILMSAILSRYLSKEIYGSYRQILYIYNSILIFVTIGLPQATSYLIAKESIRKAKTTATIILAFLFFSGIITSIILFFGSEYISILLNNRYLSSFLRQFAIIPVFLIPTLTLSSICATYNMAMNYAIYQLFSKSLIAISLCLPVLLSVNFESTFKYWALSSILSFIMMIYIYYKPFRKIKFEQSSYKITSIFSISIGMMAASIFGILFKATDKYFISRYLGPQIFAEYINGATEIPFVTYINTAIATALLPAFTRMREQKNDEKIIEIFVKIIEKTSIIIIPLSFFFLFFAKEIMIVLFSQAYSNSSIYFQLYTLPSFFRVITFTPLIISLGCIKEYAYIHLKALLIAIITMFVSIKIFESSIIICAINSVINIGIIFSCVHVISRVLKINIVNIIPLKYMFLNMTKSFASISVTYIMIWCLIRIEIINSNEIILISGLIIMMLLYSVINHKQIDENFMIKNNIKLLITKICSFNIINKK